MKLIIGRFLNLRKYFEFDYFLQRLRIEFWKYHYQNEYIYVEDHVLLGQFSS